MSRNYYAPGPPDYQYTATGDSSSGGGSGSGMECLQLRSPPAPFHYHISDQAKSLVALQELQNEVGALLEFRDLVIETFPNLRSKLAGAAAGSGVSVGSSGSSAAPAPRRDWEPGIRVRRKIQTRDSDSSSLPRSRSDSHSKPATAKGGEGGAHSVIQDSGFSTETSSSKEAHSTAAASSSSSSSSSSSGRQPAQAYELELWQLLDAIQIRGCRLRDEVEALRGGGGGGDDDPADEFRRELAAGSAHDLAALRRERDLLLDRLAELEAEALAGRAEAELRLRLEPGPPQYEPRLRPSAPGPMGRGGGGASSSAFAPVTPVRTSESDVEGDVSSAYDAELGKLDKVMNTPVRTLKVKTPDSKKISAILQENNPLELQRHLLLSTVHNQVLQGKLDRLGRSKSTLVERLHRTREENDDLKFQLEEKRIELEGTRAHMRLLESGGGGVGGRRSSSSGGAPRSMRALRPLPLHLQQSDDFGDRDEEEDREDAAEERPEGHEPITDTPRRRPSKIPLAPSRHSSSKPPTGRSSVGGLSYRSRSGDSLANSMSSSTKSPSAGGGGGLRNGGSSFGTTKSNTRDSLGRSRACRDSLTGRVRNNDSLSRIRDSDQGLAPSSSSSSSKAQERGANKKEAASSSSKKSSVPVRRASSASGARSNDAESKPMNPWTGDSLIVDHHHRNHQRRFDSQLLCDFVSRSGRLAEDKRFLYLSARHFHDAIDDHRKEEIDFAYQSPHADSSHFEEVDNRLEEVDNRLVTMDVSAVYNRPTKSDVAFFNQPLLCEQQLSIWHSNSKKQPYYDSITNGDHFDSALRSVTNDSVKREGLAECDSLDRRLSSFDTM